MRINSELASHSQHDIKTGEHQLITDSGLEHLPTMNQSFKQKDM